MDSQFLANFRVHVTTFIQSTPNINAVLVDATTASQLLFQEELLADEVTAFDNEEMKVHFSELLHQTMQDSSNMWDVRHLCETHKGCMPGFDYRIKFSADKGRPMGVVWMTKKMRFHLL
jgi:hypothetical protein